MDLFAVVMLTILPRVALSTLAHVLSSVSSCRWHSCSTSSQYSVCFAACYIHIHVFAQYYNRISAEQSVHERDVWKDLSAFP